MPYKVVRADQAVATIQDNDTVVVCGCENVLSPEKVLAALEDRFLTTGSPRNLTEIHPIIHGMGEGLGLEHFANVGMTRRTIGSGYSYLKTSRMTAMLKENKLPAYIIPMGVLYEMLSNIAAGKTHTYSKVGFGTFVDDQVEGGCMNEIAKEIPICRRIELMGEPHLCYENPRINVAIIRGTTADEFGNISLEQEPVNLGIKTLAMAAKACGGTVIAQVKRVCKKGTLPPRSVVVPGIMVDMVVVDEEQSSTGGPLNPALTGEIRIPSSEIEPLPLDPVKVVCRRAAQEIDRDDMVVNLGVGIPINIPRIQVESGRDQGTIFFPEHGSVGGVPGDRSIFGSNINPDAIIDSTNVFQYFHGGGLDISFLGFGQIDRFGNVNVSKFNGIVPGCGGFIDIAYGTRKLVFCGSFSAGGAQIGVRDGKVQIDQEGRFMKFVEEVEQITLNGRESFRQGKEVLYITERCVFRLTAAGLELTEVAPGIDVQKDIVELVPFEVIIGTPKLMDPALFV